MAIWRMNKIVVGDLSLSREGVTPQNSCGGIMLIIVDATIRKPT